MSLFQGLAETFRTGKEMIVQSLAIAAASATITTPYKFVDGVVVTLNIGTAPAITDSDTFTWTFNSSTGVVTIFAWKRTSNANPTLIAGAAACTVSVAIVGRRR